MFKYSVGETVKVIDSGCTYGLFERMAKKMGLTKWTNPHGDFFNSRSPNDGNVGIIVAKEPHLEHPSCKLYGVEVDGVQYILEERGLKSIDFTNKIAENYAI